LTADRLVTGDGGGDLLRDRRLEVLELWDGDVLHADPRLRVQPGLFRVDDLDPAG
jgi:hypothetical protein